MSCFLHCHCRSLLFSEQPLNSGVPQQLPAAVVAQQSLHQLVPASVQQLPPATAGSHQPPHPVSWHRAAQGIGQAAVSHHVPLTVAHHTGTHTSHRTAISSVTAVCKLRTTKIWKPKLKFKNTCVTFGERTVFPECVQCTESLTSVSKNSCHCKKYTGAIVFTITLMGKV